MGEPWTILAMGAGVYALRLAGFVLPVSALPPYWTRALRYLPIALLAALVASSLAGAAEGAVGRAVAVVAGALVAWRSRRMWSAIVVGLVVFWVLRSLGWGG